MSLSFLPIDPNFRWNRARPVFPPLCRRRAIVADPDGPYFQRAHAPDGKPALVLAARDAHGHVIDLVAWFEDKPGRWWLRRGIAAVLGEAEIEHAAAAKEKLRLLATPRDWFVNHGPAGVWPAACILDWTADPRDALWGAPIECESAALARRLDDAQARHDRRLVVTVAPEARHAA